jgi:hypothetical protein
LIDVDRQVVLLDDDVLNVVVDVDVASTNAVEALSAQVGVCVSRPVVFVLREEVVSIAQRAMPVAAPVPARVPAVVME